MAIEVTTCHKCKAIIELGEQKAHYDWHSRQEHLISEMATLISRITSKLVKLTL